MLLTVDIGNTTVALAGLSGREVAFACRLPSSRDWTASAWQSALQTALAEQGTRPAALEGAVLSSVVPAITGPVAKGLEALTGKPTLVVGRDTPTGLSLGEYDPSNLGMDRVVDCVAALALYGGPVAVFDMGTATTLSVADREGVFRGGMILPGLQLSLEALTAKAAQLPPIALSPPERVMGTNTEQCMRYGALYGAAGAIEGIVRRVEGELGKLTVVLTGGNSSHVYPLLQTEAHWAPNLTFLGLAEIWKRNMA